MKCSYCGKENVEGEKFCSNCGMKLELSAPGAPVGPVGPVAPVGPVPSAPSAPQVRCENCGMMNPAGAAVCAGCNQPLGEPAQPGVCPHCGFDKNPLTAKFCMNCGTQIAVEEQPPPAPPAVVPGARLVLPSAREIALSEPEVIIGRGDFLQEISPEEAKYLSREHLKITYEDGKYYILDEGSTNGTKLNGLEIKEQGKKELNDNDEIVLADTVTVRFQT